MKTRELVWVGESSDLSYAVAGNIDLTAGSKGTISFWTDQLFPWTQKYPNQWWFGYQLEGNRRVVIYRTNAEMVFATNNSLSGWSWREAKVAISGLSTAELHHFVATWDFSGGPGAGKLRIYCDGQLGATVSDTATAPEGTPPAEWQLGNSAAGTSGARGRIDNWSIWDEVMTQAQVSALYAKGPHYMPGDGDCGGNQTFLADFNETYDARVSGGDGSASPTTDVARLREAGVNPDQRLLLRLGNQVDANDVAPGWVEDVPGRSPAASVFAREAGTGTMEDEAGYAKLTLKQAEAGSMVAYLSPWSWGLAQRVRVRLNVRGLGTGRIRMGGGGNLFVYADRIEDGGSNAVAKVQVGEAYDVELVFVDIEWIQSEDGAGHNGFLLVNNAQLALAGQYSPYELDKGFLKFEAVDSSDWTGWTGDVEIRVESIELGGAPLESAAYQRTDNPYDEFSLRGKVWREEGVARSLAAPQPHAGNPVFGLSDISSWSPTAIGLIDAQVVDGSIRMMVTGTEANGDKYMGFIWSSDGVNWAEDPQNPVCLLNQFNRGYGEKMGARRGPTPLAIVQDDEAKYWLVLNHPESGRPDDYITCVAGPADSPYDFDYTMLFAGNPVARPSGSYFADMTEWPQLFPNRDMGLYVRWDPYARHPWQRYRAHFRAKHEAGDNTEYRTWGAMQSGDLLNWRGLHPSVTPYPLYPYAHNGQFWPIARDLYVSLVEFGGVSYSDGYRLVGEGSGPAAVPLRPFVDCPAGERHAFNAGFATVNGTTYYFSQLGDDLYLYTIREGGEAYYALEAGETSGRLVTCALRKPSAGWGKLMVNVDQLSANSTLKVAVLDPDTEQAIAGYEAANCDLTETGTSVEVTWQGQDLSALTGDYYMLSFEFGRAGPTDPSPLHYAYGLEPLVVQRPTVGNLRAEGQVNPANVVDPTPEFSWDYSHPAGEPQVAYQVIVSSTLANLDNEVGDVWDSGEVASAEGSCTYAGPSLAEHSVYYWKVRAKSSGGMWSDW